MVDFVLTNHKFIPHGVHIDALEISNNYLELFNNYLIQ